MIGRKETLRRYNAKPEVKRKKQEWYNRNKDAVDARIKAYTKANPEVRRKTALRHYYKKWFGLSDIPEKGNCELCGTEEDIHLHHRDGNNGRHGKPMNNDPSNFISLCRSCHMKAHSRGVLRMVL